MLVLTRKVGEKIIVRDLDGGLILTLTVVDSYGGRTRLGFDAEDEYVIMREELDTKPKKTPDSDAS